jgi:hypothetical protein
MDDEDTVVLTPEEKERLMKDLPKDVDDDDEDED